jgi:hypothetical protein
MMSESQLAPTTSTTVTLVTRYRDKETIKDANAPNTAITYKVISKKDASLQNIKAGAAQQDIQQYFPGKLFITDQFSGS